MARASNSAAILSASLFRRWGKNQIESLSWDWHIAQQTFASSLMLLLSVMALVGLFVPQSGGIEDTPTFFIGGWLP